MNSEWAEQPQSEDGPRTPGVHLKAGREAMGWSVEQVAEQLKLQIRQVVALEADDLASLPNLAVVRGFIRAYAKILKIDAAPLVAMIADPVASPATAAAAPRRDLSASFSEARFPSMTERSSKPAGLWGGLALLLVAAAGFGAYEMGLIPAGLLGSGEKGAPSAPATVVATPAATLETTLVKPESLTPAPVPLISVPGAQPETPVMPPAAPASPAATPAEAALKPVEAAAKPAEAPKAAEAPVGNNALVINVRQDSWVEIRRKGAAPLVSRLMLAGSSQSFDITEPVQLVVGRPSGVDATLRGAALELTPVPGGTASRLNLK
jgi:cytoskeleton protein RodZ